MRTLLSLGVIAGLTFVGGIVGEQHAFDPDMGRQIGANVGAIFGALIFIAARAQSG